MICNKEYKLNDVENFKQKILQWSNKFSSVTILDSNNYKEDKYSKNQYIAAFGVSEEAIAADYEGAFSKLKEFKLNKSDYIFGYFSYDLKNDIEDLKSENNDNLLFPALHFFVPKNVLIINENILSIISKDSSSDTIYNEIISQKLNNETVTKNMFKPVFSKLEYIKTVEKIKNHIQLGDIYEANFCQEFYSKNTKIFPSNVFSNLVKISPTPYSVYYKINNNYLMCSSLERFVTRKANKVISQPIKGTVRRDKDKAKDNELINQLKNDKKEVAENVMIVDLVRNDLSKFANKGTVKVEEMFGIYTFPQVHQMISTISAEITPELDSVDIIKNMFPMGSMTGAPKIRAMKLIEKYEKTKRGLYSGSVGYFTPNGDFDFNVVIRSLLYNSENEYLSFQVGGAITINSDPIKEYEECLVKAKGMLQAVNGEIKKDTKN